MIIPTINPFPGLRPFQKTESHLFFGRENHINEIMRKLETFRFVSIVGNSGSGKSSLVRAGILPKIEEKDNKSWIVCIMRPGKNPLEELCKSLFEKELFGNSDATERKTQVEQNLEILGKNRLGLVQVVRNNLQKGKKLLILADQFEEIFRFNNISPEQNNNSSAVQFVELLLGAVGQKEVPIYIIMTIRSDFLGDCEQFSGLPEAINDGQFLIPRMNREELQTSITGPIDFVKGKISPQLVHKLLNEVGTSPDQLPLLQHVLMRTWEVWEEENTPNKPIDIETYNKTGGMIKALSNHAEEAFAELNLNEEKKLAEFIFKTITLKGADNRGIRRPTSIMKIVNITSSSVEDVVKIINIFRRLERGFLMPPESIELKENSVIDISHESLMRVWERLGTWVNEEAESAEIYTRICESALLYDKNMAGLWRDPDLQIAVEWRQKNNPNVFWAKQYNSHYELAMRFIDASIQDKKFVLAEKNRRRYLTQIVISIFLIALSSLTIWAYVERNRSSRNEKLALSEKMKAELQEAFANEQKKKAEENALKAVLEKENADKATLTAFEQRKIAITNAKEAEIQKLNAEKALLTADDARKAAEIDKRIAIAQKQLSDSLKTIAFESEKNAYRLRVLSIASNLAIKSTEAKPGTYDENIKPLLALQANKFNNEFKGKSFNPELFTALFSSMRYYQNKSEYSHNFHSDYVRSVCYSSDGKTIYSVSYDGKLIACESKNLQASPRIFAPQAALLENIQFNKAQNKIMASADKTILIYDLESVTEKPKAILEHSDKITAIAWMDNYIISSSIDFKIRIFDQKIRKPIKNYALPSKPLCMSVNEGKHLLVVGCENGKVYLMKTTEKGEFLEPEELSKISAANVTSIDLNVKGNKVACGTSDGNIFIFETQNPNNKPITIRAHNSAIITSVKFSPTANQVASSAYDSYVKLWNIELPDEQPIIFKEHESWALTLAFSPDGNELVSGGRDKTVRIYSIQNHKMVDYIESKVSRNFTLTEWTNFIGNDIPYEKTISLK